MSLLSSNKRSIVRVFSILFVLLLSSNLSGQEKTKIKIQKSDKLNFYTDLDMTVFRGNVLFTHKDIKLYCDSAYQYNKENKVRAFGKVHIIQGDTINLYGDSLVYFGNTKLAQMRGNVKMTDPKITLTTNHLDYDANNNIGYYYNNGTIKDSQNTLESKVGKYYANDKQLFFKEDVVVTTPDYKLYSDTLKYTTETKIAFITGPTTIIGEKDSLYSEQGWYNTISKRAELTLNNKAFRESYSCFGDFISIDNISQTGIIKSNGVLVDTVNNIIVKADYIEAHKDKEVAFATQNAVLIQAGEQDSLFLHADTLYVEKDSSKNSVMRAYNHVKFFRKDLQGVCDSMAYTLVDSTIRLFNNPVIWANNSQITGTKISLITGKSSLKQFYIEESSLIVTQADTSMFNQISGREMTGYFDKNNELKMVDVTGNGEVIYFPVDAGVIAGVNKTKCSKIRIHLKERKIESVVFIQKPDGTIYPLSKIQAEKLKLKNFRWEKMRQPQSKEDIFIKENKEKQKNTKRGKLKELHELKDIQIKDLKK